MLTEITVALVLLAGLAGVLVLGIRWAQRMAQAAVDRSPNLFAALHATGALYLHAAFQLKSGSSSASNAREIAAAYERLADIANNFTVSESDLPSYVPAFRRLEEAAESACQCLQDQEELQALQSVRLATREAGKRCGLWEVSVHAVESATAELERAMANEKHAEKLAREAGVYASSGESLGSATARAKAQLRATRIQHRELQQQRDEAYRRLAILLTNMRPHVLRALSRA